MATPTQRELRPLGKNGPLVPRLGLGMMGLSGVYGLPAPDNERLAFLDEAYATGETFWDTADEYGDSEDLIGKWLTANPDKRKNIFLGTKFGIKSKPDQPLEIDSSPEYCRQALEKSLKRLGQSYVDIYYIHRLDKVTPIEKTMQVMVELKNEGKIKHIGLSECSAESLRRAYAVHPIACVQIEYSVFCRAIESPEIRLLETARELGMAIVAYSPIGNGFLTGKIRRKEDISKPGDLRAAIPWFRPENIENNVAIIDKIVGIAEAKGITPAQLALAWLLAQGDDIFAVPGTSKITRLNENLGSMLISLTSEEEKLIRQLSTGIVGDRVQSLMGHTFADTPPMQ